jgi:hypothetical protein
MKVATHLRTMKTMKQTETLADVTQNKSEIKKLRDRVKHQQPHAFDDAENFTEE